MKQILTLVMAMFCVTASAQKIVATGYFPSGNPIYTICISMDKTGMPIAGKLISNTVNKLAEYLNNKH